MVNVVEEITFNSLEELYQRLKPALKTKKSEMHRQGYNYIKEEDIWNFFKETKWKKAVELSLSAMVNDVLNIENGLIDDYLKNKMKSENRTVYFDLES